MSVGGGYHVSRRNQYNSYAVPTWNSQCKEHNYHCAFVICYTKITHFLLNGDTGPSMTSLTLQLSYVMRGDLRIRCRDVHTLTQLLRDACELQLHPLTESDHAWAGLLIVSSCALLPGLLRAA